MNNKQIIVGSLILGSISFFVLVAAGVYASPPGAPNTAILLGLLAVSLMFGIFYRFSNRIRQIVHTADPVLLTALQGWRIVGMIFLFFMAVDQLPGQFAILAGVGDVMIGLAAPFVAIGLVRGTIKARGVYLFHALGLIDFALAFASGTYAAVYLSGNGFLQVSALPLVIIPGLFVPVFAVLHFSAILQFRRLQRVAVSEARA